VVAGVEELSERVIAAVAEQSGLAASTITADTEIERDLGITGEGTRALLERLQNEFGIDMTDFDYDRHFHAAGAPHWPVAVAAVVAFPTSVLVTSVLGPLARWVGIEPTRYLSPGAFFALVLVACFLAIGFATTLLGSLNVRREKKIPVTVKMLIVAAALKKWPTVDVRGSQS
jgi:hypothetical protein